MTSLAAAASSVPTLTEVVAPSTAAQPSSGAPEVQGSLTPPMACVAEADAAAAPSAMAGRQAIDDSALAQAVLSAVLLAVHQRVDVLFEARVREALAPAFARATQLVLSEAQVSLAASLQDLVQQAVAQELVRLRP